MTDANRYTDGNGRTLTFTEQIRKMNSIGINLTEHMTVDKRPKY